MIRFKSVSQIYHTRQGRVIALRDVDLHIETGQFVVVRGPSGSGKTTLLMAAGGMQQPTSGQVVVDGNDLYTLNLRRRALFRANKIGFVFQMFYLIPYLSVTENILLAAHRQANHTKREAAHELLSQLGLGGRGRHRPTELSAGERQRVALARALVNRPKIILADEPTGNLDPVNAEQVFEYLSEFHQNAGTVIVVTHGTEADSYADRVISLREGRIMS